MISALFLIAGIYLTTSLKTYEQAKNVFGMCFLFILLDFQVLNLYQR